MKLVIIGIGLWVALCNPVAGAQANPELQTIPQLNVSRYLGRWYEIAKFPNGFQKKCVSDTSATYRLLPDGTLEVLNQCRQESGRMDQAIGQAKQLGSANSPKLQVRFAPAWLSMLPFVWGDYWVVDLDESYALAAVSEPARKYLWILSRTPTVDGGRYEALINRLRDQGLDVTRLEKTTHTAP